MKFKKLLSGITALSLSAFAGAGLSVSEKGMSAEAASVNWKFDFGGAGAESGYTGVSASDGYSASKGYGFARTADVANAAAGGQGAYSDAVQFKSENEGNTFNVDLPKGLYEIKVVTGNCSRTTIKMEGMLQMINLTGNNAVETVRIPVTDGQLNLQAVAGRTNTQFSISAVEITQLNDTGEMKPTIWLCGDSTVANYYNVSETSQHGWGQFLGDYIDRSRWEVRNMAASGQYAKGFVDGGQFTPIEYYGKSGDIYVISIGINDTNYSNSEEYYSVVTDMVKKAKAKGMEVVLVKQQGRRGDLTRSPLLSGRWFGGQLDTIGSEQNVTVVDLFKPWQDFGVSVGYDGMAEYYAIQANGSNDDLHQSMKGSKKLAELMSELYDFDGTSSEVFDESVMYSFKNVNSGLYMEVADAKGVSGANVQQWGRNETAPHNVWKLKSASDGYYYIYTALSENLVLDVAGNKPANGQNIALYTFNGNDNQQYKFTKNADGSYKIRTKVSGSNSAVEVINALTEAGANVQQWEVNGANCQDWIIETAKLPESTEPPVTEPPVTKIPETEPPVTEPVVTRPPVDVGKILLGDANCDGVVTIADSTAILQHLGNQDKYGLSELGYINADVTGNNDGVTSNDSLFIQMVDAGLAELPVYIPPAHTTTASVITVPDTSTETADPHYYAVDQTWTKGVAETVNTGFTKAEGYVNLDNEIDSSITFTVNVSDKGNYMTHIRFANGSPNDRKMKVYVNGDAQNYWMQSFTGTGAWTEWTEFGIVLPLNAGRNTIQFVSATAEGGPNLDYITLTLTDEPYAETYDPNSELPVISNKPTIYIAGDSTVQSYRASYAPQQGWGYYLQSYFNDNVTVANHSIAGRSTKKFYDEGRWQTIIDSLKKDDYVMIQFAINDSGKANADRYAPTCGDVNNPSAGSYEWYMTEFIKSAKEKGATPILVTTVIGMKAYSGGKFINSYSNYCDACKQLSAKYNVPCIDLNTIMVNHYNSVGYDTAKSYHLMGAVEGSTDGTHFCEKGAEIVAGLVAEDVRSQKLPGLAENLK